MGEGYSKNYGKNNNYRGRNNNSQNKGENTRKLVNLIKDKSLTEVFKPEYYALEDGFAFQIAKEMMTNKDQAMNSNQLRKIFTQLKSIDAKITKNNERFEVAKSDIYMIIPMVAYAYGRNLITKDFYDLMKACLKPEKLKSYEDFSAFVKFYTAIIAYAAVK